MHKTDNSVLWLMISNNLEGKKFIVFVNENCDKITVALETGSSIQYAIIYSTLNLHFLFAIILSRVQ
jgi:hypothetical protein